MNILITGGAGFIGSALCRYLLQHTAHRLIVVDSLTYAANVKAISELQLNTRYILCNVDICDAVSVYQIFNQYNPQAVMHLAAESHVDNSINAPAAFIQTNIVGTYTLLEQSLRYWQQLTLTAKDAFRFLHVSTDEVFGDLANSSLLFTEQTPYAPSSPYSASKASADHLVKAWYRTYGLPVMISNCSNNYGPGQHAEKLIPKAIINLLQGKAVPLYGDGQQKRDWLYVDDHAAALYQVLSKGRIGQSYLIGGNSQLSNLSLVHKIADAIDELSMFGKCPALMTDRHSLVTFVADRAGHDVCYGVDSGKIFIEMGWRPAEKLSSGLKKTVLSMMPESAAE